jgi:ligand-binding sensor domain-containing protein/anti-sigma regulatory factor (Ser/Thr protein kinase)
MVITEVILLRVRWKNVYFSLLVFFSFLNLPANETFDEIVINPVSPIPGIEVEVKAQKSVIKESIIPNQAIVTEDPYRKFEHLTRKNGLSSNYVLDILQDKQGFIWIATTEGLNRYDGHKIKQYKHISEDSTSLADDLVSCVTEDSEGNLWVGTQKGLNKFNRELNAFERVYFENRSGGLMPVNDYIRAILPDENNIVWVETAKGDLIKFNSLSKKSIVYHHDPPSMVNTYFYHDLYKDEHGMLWLGGRFMGIYRFDPKTEEFYKYLADENDKTKKREDDVAVYLLDSKNAMWVGGIDGLYTLNTKSGNFEKKLSVSTFTVVEDGDKRLWFGTGAGIYVYDSSDHSFTLMNKDDNNPSSLIHDHVNKIFIDRSQNVWIGTIDGISIFRPSKNKFKHIYHIPGDEQTLVSSNVTSIVQLRTGDIWVGTGNAGIDCLTERFIRKSSLNSSGSGEDKLNSNKISVLMQDSEGDLWAGQWSGRGFNIIDPNSLKTKSYSFLRNSLKADWYNDIFEDSKGNYWIGLWGAQGLFQFDKRRGVFKDRTFQLKQSFAKGPVKKLVFDGNELWIGLQKQSVFFSMDPKTEKLSSRLKDRYSFFEFNQIIDIFGGENGDVWFRTNKGIYRKYSNPYTSIKPVINMPIAKMQNAGDLSLLTNEFKVDTLLCKIIDADNNKWIGTYKGLFKINHSKVINHFLKRDRNGLISDTIWSIAATGPDRLWIGTEKGLCKFDIQTRRFVAVEVDKKDYLSSHLVKCIAEDRDGNIWIGTTNNGLNRLDPISQKVKQFNSNLEDSLSFWGKNVNCIFVDNAGTVWIGGHGLNRYDKGSGSFKHFTIENGLTDNEVMSILEDDGGKLWIATLNGLSVFDPENESFRNYYEKDGLQDNEFSNAACKLKSGEMAFGGKNGISVCNPSGFFVNTIPPKLSITAFFVFDKQLDVNMEFTQQIELDYDENYFSFEYTALDFSNPEFVQYAYKLENADKEWIYVDAGSRIAKYTNIDPGKYRFLVKASNGDGIWNESGIFVDLVIRPPYWKTTWFIVLEVLLIVLIVVFIIRYREKKIKEKTDFQLLEQKLLRSQMNPHFIFNSLSSIQSFIFENNPLEAGSYLSRFAELIRSILYNSREEFIAVEKEVETLKNYLELQQLRYNNKFDYFLDVDPLIQADIIKIPPMLAQPFIENAIEHGIKHLKGKGFISVSFTLMPQKGSVLLLVEDNGIGIKASKKLKSKKTKSHTSLATVIANERIGVFNKGKKKKQFIMEVDEMKDVNGRVKGTKVKFIIPYREL